MLIFYINLYRISSKVEEGVGAAVVADEGVGGRDHELNVEDDREVDVVLHDDGLKHLYKRICLSFG